MNQPGSVRRSLLVCLAVVSVAVSSIRANDAHQHPNILFILTEDQGNHLSYLGTPELQTPNIDALARRGCFFKNAFTTYPVCSASKAAIYTGIHGHANGILNNTHNYHKPPSELTAEERNRKLYQSNRVKKHFVTLIEWLRDRGYYQGVTHKLHVAPVEKFPYDEFLLDSIDNIPKFIARAELENKPWFLLANCPFSHRPFPNSDEQAIRPHSDKVRIPDFLPDTRVVRQDWSEYLASIERVDRFVGRVVSKLEDSGQVENTIVILMSDHGPAYPHGKMTLYDLGLRVPLMISGPGIAPNRKAESLACGLDLFPTLVELLGGELNFGYQLHGRSLAAVLADDPRVSREFVFAEISNRGPLPNDGIQERAVTDGRWKLIYRENVEKRWRQVNADSRSYDVWRNRVYREIVERKNEFSVTYHKLVEMDPQTLGGEVPRLEFYDLERDPDEMNNLADQFQFHSQRDRLLDALQHWLDETNDDSIKDFESLRAELLLRE